MTKHRLEHPDWYDSLEGLPPEAPRPPVPPPLPARALSPHGSAPEVEADVVSIAVRDAALRASVERALLGGPSPVAGPDAIARASLVIAEAEADVERQIAALRAEMRTDAALLLVVDGAGPDGTANAVSRACAAGAFACLRTPFVVEELTSLVGAALDSHAAKAQIANLSRQLDLEAHLVSIGRMSAGLAHEIANPLNAAITNEEFLVEGCERLLEIVRAIANASPEDLPRVASSARHVLATQATDDGVTSILAETREAHGRIRGILEALQGLVHQPATTRREPLELRALAVEVANRWLASEAAGVEVTIVGDAVWALGDPLLLGQIVQNLAANAIHAAKTLATPKLRIHTYVAGAMAVISVRDNGPGIPPELHERVFEPFYTTRRGKGGTGLGLALCREYAVRMGAELALWSIPGRGTCVRVSLPHVPAPNARV